MIDEKTLEKWKEISKKSTRVVGWYPHAHEGEVRGPFHRWFTCTGGENYPDSVASIEDDVEYAALALTHFKDIIQELRNSRKQVRVLRKGLEFVSEYEKQVLQPDQTVINAMKENSRVVLELEDNRLMKLID